MPLVWQRPCARTCRSSRRARPPARRAARPRRATGARGEEPLAAIDSDHICEVVLVQCLADLGAPARRLLVRASGREEVGEHQCRRAAVARDCPGGRARRCRRAIASSAASWCAGAKLDERDGLGAGCGLDELTGLADALDPRSRRALAPRPCSPCIASSLPTTAGRRRGRHACRLGQHACAAARASSTGAGPKASDRRPAPHGLRRAGRPRRHGRAPRPAAAAVAASAGMTRIQLQSAPRNPVQASPARPRGLEDVARAAAMFASARSASHSPGVRGVDHSSARQPERLKARVGGRAQLACAARERFIAATRQVERLHEPNSVSSRWESPSGRSAAARRSSPHTAPTSPRASAPRPPARAASDARRASSSSRGSALSSSARLR